MAAGVRAAGRDAASIVRLPLSDGGDGLLDAIAALAPSARRRAVRVTGPSGDEVRAEYLSDGPRSILESARACGLRLVPPARRDPLTATSFGVGELILAAGPGPLVLGLGGSATVDGGAGMARALGWRLLDGAGRPVPPGGGGLRSLRRVVPPDGADGGGATGATGWGGTGAGDRGGTGATGWLAATGGTRERKMVALADVRAPLLGAAGAAREFGPQKGADAAAVLALEEGLSVLAERLRADLGVDVAALPGTGAAGGLGAGAIAFLGARLVAGSEWMLDEARFDARLARASLVVTGEGAYDGQSGMGKIVGSVVDRAVLAGVPAVVIAGRAAAPDRPGVLVRAGGGRRLHATDLARLTAGALAEMTAGGGAGD